ncbi:MAG: hypothetical protein K0Q74_1010 [Gammaproteobacteria bacterium]|jgi:hypothetical protein|nr:hypothetical protein [Gammaproteobacteria bacterium]
MQEGNKKEIWDNNAAAEGPEYKEVWGESAGVAEDPDSIARLLDMAGISETDQGEEERALRAALSPAHRTQEMLVALNERDGSVKKQLGHVQAKYDAIDALISVWANLLANQKEQVARLGEKILELKAILVRHEKNADGLASEIAKLKLELEEQTEVLERLRADRIARNIIRKTLEDEKSNLSEEIGELRKTHKSTIKELSELNTEIESLRNACNFQENKLKASQRVAGPSPSLNQQPIQAKKPKRVRREEKIDQQEETNSPSPDKHASSKTVSGKYGSIAANIILCLGMLNLLSRACISDINIQNQVRQVTSIGIYFTCFVAAVMAFSGGQDKKQGEGKAQKDNLAAAKLLPKLGLLASNVNEDHKSDSRAAAEQAGGLMQALTVNVSAHK